MKKNVLPYIGVTLFLFGGSMLMYPPTEPEQQYIAPKPKVEHTMITAPPAGPAAPPAAGPAAAPQSIQSSVSKPVNGARVQNVPLIQQLPELERGCEVTSLAMILQYVGKKVDKMTLAEQIKKVPFRIGEAHGNPNDGQVGDIYSFSNAGYGVYHGPIFQLLQTYMGDRALDITGQNSSQMYEAVRQGSPVWVITNATFSPLEEDEFETWETATGPVSITYHEHSVVIVGYDDDYVYINDPLDEEREKAVNRKSFEEAWIQMGSQAITYR